MMHPGFDPKGWAGTAEFESEDYLKEQSFLFWIVTVVFGAVIATLAYFHAALGWIALILFWGVCALFRACVLPSVARLDAGRSYLEQAATVNFEAVSDLQSLAMRKPSARTDG